MTTESKIPAGVVENIVNIRAQTPLWKHILWAVVAVLFLWALAQIPNTIIVFSMAWLIAYLLNPAVDALQARIGSRTRAISMITLIIVSMMVAAGAWMVPHLTDQVQRLLSLQDSIQDPMTLPMTLREKVEPLLARVPEAYRDQAMERASTFIQDSASKIGAWVSAAIGWLGSFLGQLLSGVFLVCTAFLISLYMLMNWHGMGETFLQTLPKQYRDEVRSLSQKMNQIFGAYVKATILTSIACMIATFVSLVILSSVTGHAFPYKGLIAFVAGIAYPVPVIGIIATSILGGVLGYLPESNVGFGVAVLVVINVVNMIIDRTVQPKLMSDAIGVSELFVMFAAFAGGEVAGIWGMLLGIPVAAMGKALFDWFHSNFLLVEELSEEEIREVRGPRLAGAPKPRPRTAPATAEQPSGGEVSAVVTTVVTPPAEEKTSIPPETAVVVDPPAPSPAPEHHTEASESLQAAPKVAKTDQGTEPQPAAKPASRKKKK